MIQVGVLSVAAQQLLSVIRSRRDGSAMFSIGNHAPLSLHAGGLVAVTMNPNYKGRVSLPDNLKVIFIF